MNKIEFLQNLINNQNKLNAESLISAGKNDLLNGQNLIAQNQQQQQNDLVRNILDKKRLHDKQSQLLMLQQQQIRLINGHLSQKKDQNLLSQFKATQQQQEQQKQQESSYDLEQLRKDSTQIKSSQTNSSQQFMRLNELQPLEIPSHIEINHVNGRIKNAPSSIMLDQFGMLGLLMMIKQNQNAQSHQLNEHASDSAERIRLFDFYDQTPQVYALSSNPIIKSKLCEMSTVLKTTSDDDLLFFLFYMCSRSELQLEAHKELTNRNWSYDKEHKSWLKHFKDQNNNKCVQMFEPTTWTFKVLNLVDYRALPKQC